MPGAPSRGATSGPMHGPGDGLRDPGRRRKESRRCSLFIGNDCSFGHLAAACEVPVVSVIGPTNPALIRPWGVPHRVVRLDTTCSPCFEVSRRPLRCSQGKDFACVREIPVKRVLAAVDSLLKELAEPVAPRRPVAGPWSPARGETVPMTGNPAQYRRVAPLTRRTAARQATPGNMDKPAT